MSEKKVVSRKVAIALGIICVILAVGLVGAVTNYISVIKGKCSQIQTLTNQKNQLQTWLNGNKTLLNQIKTWLQGNITTLQNQIGILQTWLQRNITQYSNYVIAYQKLRDKINSRWDDMEPWIFITPYDSMVSSLVYNVTGGWSNTSDWNEFWNDVKAMYDWVTSNIIYSYDQPYPMLPDNPNGTLEYGNEIWQFPNETITSMQGDCEDQAILLDSMIACYTNNKYPVETITICGATVCHVAVQIPVANHELTILDPAGYYYTQNSLGELTSKDIRTEITNWLDYWKPEMGNDVYVYEVFSDSLDQWFNSTEEYITWMCSR